MGHKETPIQKKILDAISKLPGARFTRTQSGKINIGRRWIHMGETGWFDITGAYLGVPVGIEVKVEGVRTNKKREEDQAKVADGWRVAGGVAIKVESVEEALGELEKIKAGRE